jgi:hypothetical protein
MKSSKFFAAILFGATIFAACDSKVVILKKQKPTLWLQKLRKIH